jgi:hypothetical protein
LLSCKTVVDIKNKPNNHILNSDIEIHEVISSIVTHTSRLDKFFRVSNQRDDEGEKTYIFRKDRAEYLRKLLLKKNSREIYKASIRNAIEHIDERLDLIKVNILDINSSIHNKTLLLNMTLSSQKVFSSWKDILPLQVFLVHENHYYVINENLEAHYIDLSILFDEVKHIAKKCSEFFRDRPDGEGETLENPAGILKASPHQI